jgi:hypothetical protein
MRRLVSRLPSAAGWLVVLVLLAASRISYGSPLIGINFTPNGPGVDALIGTLSYNASTLDFNATTTDPNALTLITPAYSTPSNPNFLTAGFFDPTLAAALTFDVHVNASGNLVAGGTGFSLSGAVDIDGDGLDDPKGTTTSMTLLTGTITNFGTNGPGPPTVTFNGVFRVTGGLLTGPLTLSNNNTIPALFPVGSFDGFTLAAENVSSGILGDFRSSFSSTMVKPYAGAFVPEPGSLVLALSGAVTVCGYLMSRGRFASARR